MPTSLNRGGRVQERPIYFYAPDHERFLDFAGDFREFWHWLCVKTAGRYWIGPFSWTLQTYYRLLGSGAPVELVGEIPESGVVVGHVNLLPSRIPDRVFAVCIKPDKPTFHGGALIHVVQNSTEKGPFLWDIHYLQYWPQPSLIPRDPDRGATVENVDFVGNLAELAPELQDPAFARGIVSERFPVADQATGELERLWVYGCRRRCSSVQSERHRQEMDRQEARIKARKRVACRHPVDPWIRAGLSGHRKSWSGLHRSSQYGGHIFSA